MKKIISIILTLAASTICSSEAVIPHEGTDAHYQGDGAGAGWNYVGNVNSASGVFLGGHDGNYWVLTNAHVGVGQFNINGKTYDSIPGSTVRVGSADLILYKITVDEGDQLASLPALRLSSKASSLQTGSEVVMIGYGGVAFNDEIKTWKVDTSTNPNTWSTNMDDPGIIRSGYQVSAGVNDNSKKWATNTLESFVSGNEMIRMNFSEISGEGQAVSGDSGGGIFYFNEEANAWELAGIMSFVSTLNGQPGGTVVFGDSTWALSTSRYYDEIYRLMGVLPPADDENIPEPVTAILITLASLVLLPQRRRRGAV